MSRLSGIDLETVKSMSDEDFVTLLGKSFEPELARLKNAKASAQLAATHPPGYLGSDNATPSRFLYGEDHPECNRTLVSLLALKWISTNNYEAFAGRQPEATRLSKNSWEELRKQLTSLIHNTDMFRALAVITVTNDIGKDPTLAGDVAKHGIKVPAGANHDDIGYLAAKSGMLPVLDMLPAHLKTDSLLGCQMGTRLNIPQLAQAENVPGSLQHVMIMENHERAFELKFFEVLLDIAGAAGHVDARYAVAMTQPVYSGLSVCRKVLLELLQGKNSLRGTYDEVLKFRGSLVKGDKFPLLSVDDIQQRALLRLLTIGRVANEQRALQYKRAFDSLPSKMRENLCNGMNLDGTPGSKAIIPYYAPALFDGATKGSKTASGEAQVAVLASLMRFLARVYEEGKPKPADDDIVERELYFANKMVNSKEFVEGPEVLDEVPIEFTT